MEILEARFDDSCDAILAISIISRCTVFPRKSVIDKFRCGWWNVEVHAIGLLGTWNDENICTCRCERCRLSHAISCWISSCGGFVRVDTAASVYSDLGARVIVARPLLVGVVGVMIAASDECRQDEARDRRRIVRPHILSSPSMNSHSLKLITRNWLREAFMTYLLCVIVDSA